MEDAILKERYELAMERIGEIAGESTVPENYRDFFKRTAGFILTMEGLYKEIQSGASKNYSLEEWKELNKRIYSDIMPENYDKSYGNPDYAVEVLGKEHGNLLSFLYGEIRSMTGYVFEQQLENIVILAELFIEVYNAFEAEELPSYKQIQQIIYWFESDYTDITVARSVVEGVDPSRDFAAKIVMESDLNDLRYLYQYGVYISDNELKMAEYLNSLPEEKIQLIADTYSEGYRTGFINSNKDLSIKETVQVRYPVGFERVIRVAIGNFAKMGLKPVMGRGSYGGGNPNPQYGYDHREDSSIYLDKNYVERRLGVMRTTYEGVKDLARKHAGPAVFFTFGEKQFKPVNKDTICKMTDKQQKLMVEMNREATQITRKYIIWDERSFTMISFPSVEIGENFAEIFDETIRINTLDINKYSKIQQSMIDALDQGEKVHVVGKGDNHTDLYIALAELEDPTKQTLFENCLADVNIPVGEVFTSPKLTGTNGVLEINVLAMGSLVCKNLHIEFKDGMVTDYTCENFDNEEENKNFVKRSFMGHHDTIPMGEFAIGTNTTAYAVGEKYGINAKFSGLIAEKTGPHFALGDTCFSYREDHAIYNPDGKEMIARDNEVSILRKTDISKAYMSTHCDLTIPYKELDYIRVIKKDGTEISIIEDSRFVLPGTEELNKAFDE